MSAVFELTSLYLEATQTQVCSPRNQHRHDDNTMMCNTRSAECKFFVKKINLHSSKKFTLQYRLSGRRTDAILYSENENDEVMVLIGASCLCCWCCCCCCYESGHCLFCYTKKQEQEVRSKCRLWVPPL